MFLVGWTEAKSIDSGTPKTYKEVFYDSVSFANIEEKNAQSHTKEENIILTKNGSLIQPREFPQAKYDEGLSCDFHYLSLGETYVIQSQNYPYVYPKYHTCSWFLWAPDAVSITITCSPFDVYKYNSICRRSYLYFYGGDLEATHCGSKWYFEEISHEDYVSIIFQTNDRRETGFQCEIYAQGASTSFTTPFPSMGSMSTWFSTTNLRTTMVGTIPSTTLPADCNCGKVNRVPRIVGGVQTEVHEYPWQVALVSFNAAGRPFCGGTIISDQWILTAAHCVIRKIPSDLYIVIGEHDWSTGTETSVTQVMAIAQIIVHVDYDSSTEDNDIALIKLSQQIVFPADNKIAPICLPDAGNQYNDVETIVTGWGTDSIGGSQPYELYEVTVPTMSNTQCEAYYGASITDNMICAGYAAGGKDSCSGDSGGPLITYGNAALSYFIEIGVVSFGNGCAEPNFPGVYTRVGNYLSWIEDNIAGSKMCPSP
ncbi:hypothetical protein SK128_023119 [Halocaridina rubra]|uniref:Uncharacterized protein n=1 Tax=Halocaridina rubra TaxID=373956 RepID=A0AAN8XIM4_HALRR